MKSDGIAKQFILVFLVALVGYFVLYYAIEGRRKHNGPWQITFTNGVSGEPAFVINQPKLGITNLSLTFPGATTSATNLGTLTFVQPQETPFDIPFGKCIFQDLTSLPGTLTFDMFGHEIELIPRVLTIDKKERPWESTIVITLPAFGTNAP
jgi:hypothetical protein